MSKNEQRAIKACGFIVVTFQRCIASLPVVSLLVRDPIALTVRAVYLSIIEEERNSEGRL